MTKIYFNNDNLFYYYNIKPNLYNINKCLELKSCDKPDNINNYVSVGPIKHFKSAFSTNVITILKRMGIYNIESFDIVKLYDINTNYTIDKMLECIWDDNDIIPNVNYPTDIDIDNSCLNKYGIKFDTIELELYKNLYKKLNRKPTFIELYDLCQSNSEHSRHWFFKGQLYIDNKLIDKTLFDMIKSTLHKNSNSLIAFSDNSSVINGYKIHQLLPENIKENNLDIVLTAETHNFPTLICPFQGANTGVGGRIRDNHATGRGAYIISSLAGYCVGNIDLELDNMTDLKYNYKHPLNILIEASNGASDYGNKIGEPIIGGFTRSYGINEYEWIKPIMFSAGIGSINRYNLIKKEPSINMHIVRIGGPAYKIGLGGGFSSSLDQNDDRSELNLSAVQRGDPLMCNKLNRVIRICSEMEDNPILSIHDQGAGGLANVIKEIIYPNGGVIYLDNVTLGDKTMKPLDIWCSEFQESDVILVDNIDKITNICKNENICCDILGNINNSGKIVVYYNDKELINLPLKEILEPDIQKKYYFSSYKYKTNYDNNYSCQLPFESCLKKVLNTIDVGSKRFLINKVDRSVSGLIVQQQCVGPFQTPISNYSCVSLGYYDEYGIASAIGEKPILGLTDPIAQASMTIGELITNIMGIYIGNIENIKCSGNWMWPLNNDGEMTKLYEVAKELCYGLKELKIGIDGGKDSLSMSIKNNNKTIKSPGQIVLTGYSPVPNIYKKLTPNLKKINTNIVLIKLSPNNKLGRSIFSRVCLNNNIELECPRLSDYNKLKKLFDIIQKNIYSNKILSLHDISDGGLITSLCEMSISSNVGLNINIPDNDINSFLFSEEIGIICEIDTKYIDIFLDEFKDTNIYIKNIGCTKRQNDITILKNNNIIEKVDILNILKYWEYPSLKLEKHQSKLSEYNELLKLNKPIYFLPKYVEEFCYKYYHNTINNYIFINNLINNNIKVLILRDDGSNGDKEMEAVFKYVGFDTCNINTTQLLKNPSILRYVKGIIYVGGFSHGDVLGSAHGWYLSIKYNNLLSNELEIFMNKPDTFSLGVCNGCQLMVKQGIFGSNLKLVQNDSKIFESRFTTVKIVNSNNIFFKNMNNMSFGIWVAHGEGKFINVKSLPKEQIALKYSHINYPNNPNGSEENLAGLCYNKRHLAMMPHPERCFMKWQLPNLSKYDTILESPWLMMFKNIYDWCITN